MKKLMFLLVAVGALALSSCETASKKSEGTYTGNHTAPIVGTQAGTVSVTSDGTGGQSVNMNLACPNFALSSTANAVVATISGSNVTYSYTSTGTADGDITSLTGTLTDKTLTLAYTVMATGNPISCTFTGTKP